VLHARTESITHLAKLSMAWSQFHQRFMPTFFVKNLESKITKWCFGFEILAMKILYEKLARKMLMKLTPGGLVVGVNRFLLMIFSPQNCVSLQKWPKVT